jgi:hypothetical protein
MGIDEQDALVARPQGGLLSRVMENALEGKERWFEHRRRVSAKFEVYIFYD